MRTDFTAAFIAAKNSASRKPRQLLVLQFPVAGNIYLSDQEIVLGEVTYQGFVEDWGTLTDVASIDADFTAETRQVSITVFNGGLIPLSNLFLQEDPENVTALLYQWFEGLADTDKALIDRFVVQDPIQFFEVSRLLTMDLVSLNQRYVGMCGGTVTTVVWPNAKAEDVGKYIPLIYGSAGEIPGLYVRTAQKATLKGSIAPLSFTIR